MGQIVRETVGETLISLMPQAGLTVTFVDISPDMRLATVWVSTIKQNLSDEQILKNIAKNKSKLQQALKNNVRAKFIPRLRFRVDEGKYHADKIDEIIDKLK